MSIPEFKNLNNSQLDTLENMFNRGFKEGEKHTVPSPETLARLNKIEATLDTMMDSFKDHSKNSEQRIEQIVLEFREGMKDVMAIKEFLNNASFTKRFLFSTAGVIAALTTFGLGTYMAIKSIINGN